MSLLRASFLPEGGLGKGSHFPVLFLIVGEALGRMIKGVANVGLVEGFRVARNTTAINHLQYANDTLIFCGEDEDQIRDGLGM